MARDGCAAAAIFTPPADKKGGESSRRLFAFLAHRDIIGPK
jgi:hypothetical protein